MIELDLYGSDYGIGYEHGRRCRDEARVCVRFWGRIDLSQQDRIDTALADAIGRLRGELPWFEQRLQGISDGTGIPLRHIQLTNLCETIWNEVTGWCSVLALRHQDGVVLGKSSDTGTGSSAFHLVERVHPDRGLAFLRASFAGYSGTCAGINQAGLAFAGSSVKVAPADFGDGIALEPIPEDVLRNCEDCAEAVEHLARFELRSQAANLMFADAQGHACRVFKYPAVQSIEWMNAQPLGATNHFTTLERSFGTLPGDEPFADNSRCRLDHLRTQGARVQGDPVAFLQRLFHTPLRDGGLFQENHPMLGTCATYVIVPKHRLLYVAHGESTDARYVPYSFTSSMTS